MEKYFPANRLPSLYSDFRRLKEINVDGYNANVETWKLVLTRVVSERTNPEDDKLSFQASGLTELFHSDTYGVPLALDCVIDSAVQDHTFYPLNLYLKLEKPLNQQPFWRSPIAVFSWALGKTGLYQNTWQSAATTTGYDNIVKLKPQKYVVLPLVEKQAAQLLATINKDHTGGAYTTTLFTKHLFRSLLAKDLTTLDVDILLTYLSRDTKEIAVREDTIKFGPDHTITEQDRAVANLRQTYYDATKRTNKLSSQITTLTQTAKAALDSENRTRAKFALKSRRLAQDAQDKALELGARMEATLHAIDSAATNVEVMNALAAGVDVLSSLNSAVGGAERVAHLVDELEEASADADEIAVEINKLGAGRISEDEVDQELEDLLEQEQKKKQIKEQKQKQEQEKEQEQEALHSRVPAKLAKAPKAPMHALLSDESNEEQQQLDELTKQMEQVGF